MKDAIITVVVVTDGGTFKFKKAEKGNSFFSYTIN